MGTYTNIYFEKEQFSINTKYLYPEDVVNQYKQHNKIFFELAKDEDNEDVYLMFNNQEWDGYKHELKFYNCGYNFFYNSETGILKKAILNDFYLSLCDFDSDTTDTDMENKYYVFNNITITDICKFDKRIAFIKDNITCRVWFDKNNNITSVIFNKENDFTLRTVDIENYNYIEYSDCEKLYKIDNVYDRLLYLLNNLKKEHSDTTKIKQIISLYDKYIKHKIETLKQFLLEYNENERIIINTL